MTDPGFFHSKSFRNLYPFSSKYIKIKGLDYHYVDEGKGEPLVMVHGNPTWSFYFRRLIEGFSDRFRCIVPDHIGCGLSDKPTEKKYDFRLKSRVDDLEFFLEKLRVKNDITLVLHDWGGMIGSAFATRHPERIKRLVILNTAAFFLPEGKNLPFRLQLARNFTFFAGPAILKFNLFAVSALYMASRKGLSREVKKALLAPYDSPRKRIAIMKFVQDIPIDPTDPSYATVKQTQDNLFLLKEKPMLICWGMRDFVFDEDFLDQWIKRFPEAQVHKFADAGHYVLEDEAENILECMNQFFEGQN
jgi:haloalkane dehalogenase